MGYLTAGLLDEVAAVLDVRHQIGVREVQNTDSLVDEKVRKNIFHSKGHIQDMRHLSIKIKQKKNGRTIS